MQTNSSQANHRRFVIFGELLTDLQEWDKSRVGAGPEQRQRVEHGNDRI